MKFNKEVPELIKNELVGIRSNTIWFTSDPHFNHTNVIRYCNRPFNNVIEMNNAIIKNILDIVPFNDMLFILGDIFDVSWLSSLNVYKNIHLIMGNHDRLLKRRAELFNAPKDYNLNLTIHEYPILINKFIFLSHEPMEYIDKTPYINIHGHMHNKEYGNGGLYPDNHYYNACLEMNDYKPVNIQQVCSKLGIYQKGGKLND